MSDIDDIFKNNLDNKGIAYSETYWQDMEKLLDKEKSRKFFLRAGVLAFALFAFLLGSVWYFAVDKTPKIQKPSLSQSATVTNKGNEGSSESVFNENGETILTDRSSGNLNNTVSVENKKVVLKKSDKSNNNSVNDKDVRQPLTASSLIPAERNISADSKVEITAINEYDDRLCLMALKPIPMERMPFENMLISFHPVLKPVINKPVLTSTQEDSMKKLVKCQYYIAPGYEFDKYSRTENSALLKENEKTLNRSGFNVNIIAKKKNWGIKSGFGILQLSELTNYATENKHYAFDTTFKMINPNYEQTAGGSKIALIKRNIDTAVTTSSSVNSPDSKVNFTYLKIPLMVTYEFRLRQLSIYLDAGLNTAFLLNTKGNYTSFENNQFVLRNVKDKNDLNKVLFQTSATAGVKYSLSKTLNVFGGYGVSRSLNSMMKSYSQKPIINLLTFGLEIKI